MHCMCNNNFNHYFNIVNELACKKKILWKAHYDTIIDKNGTYILRLNYRTLIPKLKDHYYEASMAHLLENTDLAHDLKALEASFREYKAYIDPKWLDIGSFRKELEIKDYCLISSYPVLFFNEKNPREKPVYRSALIDIQKLQETGVTIDNLLSDNRVKLI